MIYLRPAGGWSFSLFRQAGLAKSFIRAETIAVSVESDYVVVDL